MKLWGLLLIPAMLWVSAQDEPKANTNNRLIQFTLATGMGDLLNPIRTTTPKVDLALGMEIQLSRRSSLVCDYSFPVKFSYEQSSNTSQSWEFQLSQIHAAWQYKANSFIKTSLGLGTTWTTEEYVGGSSYHWTHPSYSPNGLSFEVTDNPMSVVAGLDFKLTRSFSIQAQGLQLIDYSSGERVSGPQRQADEGDPIKASVRLVWRP